MILVRCVTCKHLSCHCYHGSFDLALIEQTFFISVFRIFYIGFRTDIDADDIKSFGFFMSVL